MTHTFISRKVQTSKTPTYQPYECTPYLFYCNETVPCGYSSGSVRDPIVDTVQCPSFCPSQNICLKPNRDECYIGLNSDGLDPLINIEWDREAPNLRCVFDLNKIDRADQLRVYESKFANSPYVNTLMGALCGKRVSKNCGGGLKECSRYVATDEEGKMCRNWLASLPRDIQDAEMTSYCLENDTPDCKCINRTTDPEYDRLKTLSNYFNDNCWYKPCASSASLVPHRTSSQHCAENVCQQIIEASAKGNVIIDGNTSDINCNFKDGALKPVDTKPVDTPQEWFSWKLITIACVPIILLLILYKR